MFTVVVPTFNRADVLQITLNSLFAQDTDVPFEVVVVDNNSSDDTRAVVMAAQDRHGSALRYVFAAEQGSSAARNAGIAAARGDTIAFVDDDVVVDRGWLAAVAETFRAHPEAWCVGGPVTLRLPDRLPSWFDTSSEVMTTYLSRLDFGPGTMTLAPPRVLITANLTATRNALEAVGGFDVRLGRFGLGLLCGEDTQFCHQIWEAGGQVVYCGRAAVTHLVPGARVTKRFFRGRAYWEGRTAGVLAARSYGTLSRLRLARDGWTLVKDGVRAVTTSATGEPRKAFEYELAARKRWGYIQQALAEGAYRAAQTPMAVERGQRR
jgi:glycosyltransferase involved in cell wall biosynthesis